MENVPRNSDYERFESDLRLIDANLSDVMRHLFYSEQSVSEEGRLAGVADAKRQLNKAMDRLGKVRGSVKARS
ncbi:hypothetical protein V0M98_38230 (plasmid) [Pseudomonas silesiensis]|uniref:hypothetical protein n=1 Tax=Pseudomonas silesiensis TaxID=1853130 RepID=UPI0030D31F33